MKQLDQPPLNNSRVKGIFRDPLDRRTLFSTHADFVLFLFLHILEEFSCTNLTSQELLQKQSNFDKIDRSLFFLNF